MKIHIGKEFPPHFREAYPGEFELFHHFETTAGIPNVLFAVTTWKENGQPNVCFHGWSCFHGDNMGRYESLVETIHQNGLETDEFAAGGFTPVPAHTIHAPAIEEAFLTLECTLHSVQDLSGAGITAMVIGQVQHATVEESYARGYGRRYGQEGFMLLVPAPQDLLTGAPGQSGIATLCIEKLD